MPYMFGCLWEPEEGVGSPGAGLTGSYEVPYVGAGPVEEQQVRRLSSP